MKTSKPKKEVKPEEVFKDKSENKIANENPKKTVETETDPKPVKEEIEPLYQKKVYAIDLKSLGIKVEGKELIVDVMGVKDGKAKIECGQVKCEVPKEFLFDI